MLWILLACGEEPEPVSYCPQSSFEEAVVEAYCSEQEDCGWYQSKAACLENQHWAFGCSNQVYDPSIGALCLEAISDWGENGCGVGLDDIFVTEGESVYSPYPDDPYWPGRRGCGMLMDGKRTVAHLCDNIKNVRDTCD